MKLSQAMEGFLYDFQANGNSPRTARLYRLYLGKLAGFLEDKEVEEVTHDNLQAYMMYLRTDYKPNRLNGDPKPLSAAALDNHWKAFRSFFGWADQVLGVDRPDLKIAQPDYDRPVVKSFSENEIRQLVKATEFTKEYSTEKQKTIRAKRPTADRDKALVLLMLDTGLRVGEITRLTIEDIVLESGEVFVAPFGRGIKSKPRVVYLGNAAKRAMWLYLARKRANARKTEKVFEMDDESIRSLLRRLGEKVGVENVHPHRFRHTFAIWFLRNGGDVYTLMRLLGHSSLEMSRKYLDLAEADDERAHRKASPADNWRL